MTERCFGSQTSMATALVSWASGFTDHRFAPLIAENCKHNELTSVGTTDCSYHSVPITLSIPVPNTHTQQWKSTKKMTSE